MSQSVELLESLGLELKFVSNTNGGEYKGPCPICGGEDRFSVSPNHPKYPNGAFICRSCSYKGGSLKDLILDLNGDVSELQIAEEITKEAQFTNMREPPSKEWQESILNAQSYKLHSYVYDVIFKERGIKPTTVKELKLFAVLNPEYINFKDEKIKLDPGLYIPNFRGDDLYGVEGKLFRASSKYKSVKGSVKVPYLFSKVNDINTPVIIVESALDAAIIYQEAGDLINSVALSSVSQRPDRYIETALSNASQIYVCLDYDYAGIHESNWWIQNYPEAYIVYTPKGKDVGEFYLLNQKVRQWIKSLLSGSEIPKRPYPQFETTYIDKHDEAQALLEELANKQLRAGIALSEHYISLALDQQVFSIDLSLIPLESLNILENIQMTTFEGVSLIQKFQEHCLDVKDVDCVKLQYGTLTGLNVRLAALSNYYLGYFNPYSEDEFRRNNMDAHTSYEISKILSTIISNRELDKPYRLFADSQWPVAQMQHNGFLFDRQKHEELYNKWQREFDELSESSENYDRIKHLLDTYGTSFLRFYNEHTMCIHPDLDYRIENTGRFVCSEPNLLGIPKNELRQAFSSREGCILIGADYSQIDFRVAVMISGDDKKIKALNDGVDFHSLTASALHNTEPNNVSQSQRDEAKEINYGILYGGQNKNVQQAKSILKQYYPKFYNWLDSLSRKHQREFEVTTPSGRKIGCDWGKFKQWKNQIVNYPVQAGSAEVMQAALSRLPNQLEGLDASLILCIHDEIILEVSESDLELVKSAVNQAMTHGFLDIFPDGATTNLIDIKSGHTWYDLS